jgi:xylan 1,4-beta-xylosidase
MMPVDRRAVHLQGPLEAMASSNNHKAAVLIWNRGAYARRLDVHLNNLPFHRGTVRIYRIDEKHGSWVDGAPEDLVAGETYPLDSKNWSWVDGSIPRSGVLYVEALDDIPEPVATSVEVAKIVRINRYYPARGKTTSYADFDRKTWTARLGMEGSPQADQEVGVLAENLPDELQVSVSTDGKLQTVDGNSLLGVRVDYLVDGNYTKSVLLHGPVKGVDVYAVSRKTLMPFGTHRPPDVIRAVPDFSTFLLALKSNAPANWLGTADLTFIMQDAGVDARAKITIRRVGPHRASQEQ